MHNQEELKESIFAGADITLARRRQDMLPWWIKVGSWVYLVYSTGTIILIAYRLAVLGGSAIATLFSDTADGLLYTFLMRIAGCLLSITAAVGLLKEKNWAVNYALMYCWLVVISNIIVTYRTGLYLRFFGQYSNGLYRAINISLTIFFMIVMYRLKDEWQLNLYARQQILNPESTITEELP